MGHPALKMNKTYRITSLMILSIWWALTRLSCPNLVSILKTASSLSTPLKEVGLVEEVRLRLRVYERSSSTSNAYLN